MIRDPSPDKAVLNWSGGKDSVFCLHQLRKEGIQVDALLTNINKQDDAIAMHGVPRSLLEAQARSLQIPLYTTELEREPSMADYENEQKRAYNLLRSKGFSTAIFGDLFLEDLKLYREQQMSSLGMRTLFPLWHYDTSALVHEFIDAGYKAIIVVVNQKYLDRSFCGRMLDHGFLHDLPLNVDPCGENGEYHSLVIDGPLFSQPLEYAAGNVVETEYASPNTSTEKFWQQNFR